MKKHYIEKGIEQAKRMVNSSNLSHAIVSHDSWCNLLNDRGECNCDADVLVVTDEEYKRNYCN